MKWIERISLWWKFDGRYMHKEFAHGIKNLWRWFPTVWKDRDWDHSYVYEIIRVKLEHQAKSIGNRDRHTTAKRDSDRMRLVAKLIKLQQDDFYHMEYMDYHETKYDFVPTDETKQWYTMEDTLISERFDEYFAKYPKQYQQILAQEMMSDTPMLNPDEKKYIAMAIAHTNMQRCRKLIFKIMESEIEKWWD
jgi:hypothetical protein